MMQHVWLFAQLLLGCWPNTLLLMCAGSSAVGLKPGHRVCWAHGTGEGKVHHPMQHGGSTWELGIKLLGGRRTGVEYISKMEDRLIQKSLWSWSKSSWTAETLLLPTIMCGWGWGRKDVHSHPPVALPFTCG